MFATEKPHPYGVLPPGNFYLAPIEIRQVRSKGLGDLSNFSDDVLLNLLSYLDGSSLVKFSSSSRASYVYSNHSDLWRDLTLLNFRKGIRYEKSWRNTYMKMLNQTKNNQSKIIEHIPISVYGIFSDTLYRPWLCRYADLSTACPGFYDHNDIPLISKNELKLYDFVEKYEKPNKPVIIKDLAREWQALSKWSEGYLSSYCGNREFRATSATAPLAAQFTLNDYFEYSAAAEEEAPLYLFERDFADITNKSYNHNDQNSDNNGNSSSGLAKDYDVPLYFNTNDTIIDSINNNDNKNHNNSDNGYDNDDDNISNSMKLRHHTDLFHLLGPQRPDYRWLVIGPKRSGSIFHIDPNQTHAWNAVIRGRKKWIFYPPHIAPPGVMCSDDGADVTVPLSTGEWLLSFWKYHLECRKHPDPSCRPLECIVNEGDVIFVPHGYWHMVLNLDQSIAITQNYVSNTNLIDVLRFLKFKEDQISGVRDRSESGAAVKAEQLYDTFVHALKNYTATDDNKNIKNGSSWDIDVMKVLKLSTQPPSSYNSNEGNSSDSGNGSDITNSNNISQNGFHAWQCRKKKQHNSKGTKMKPLALDKEKEKEKEKEKNGKDERIEDMQASHKSFSFSFSL